MEDCIFCKIVKNEIPCYKVYEDDLFLAFLDINPTSLGHTLLIPKNHYRWVYDVPEFKKYWKVAQKIALSIKNSSLKPDFVTFLTMGNEVPHAHIHIIPRNNSDQVGSILSSIPHIKISDKNFLEISTTIKNSLK
jgi:histidine triad (HIT) family protein